MPKKYDTIDLLKFIGSILVFTMHLNLFLGTTANLAVQLAARWCVPFFFITSSFFLFKKADNGVIPAQKLKSYVKRILLLYLAWMIINIPSIVYMRIITNGVSSPLTYFNLIKNTLLSSSFTGSWYLAGSVFSAVVIYFLSKKLSSKAILICTFPFYLICVTTSVYGGVLNDSLSFVLKDMLCFPTNIFGGLFYFALGKFLAENHKKLKSISLLKICLLLGLAFAAYCAEVLLANKLNVLSSTDFALSTALTGFAFVLLGMNLNLKIKNSLVLRKASTIIYCAQGNVLLLNGATKKLLHISNDILLYCIMLFVMAVIVAIILLLQKKTNLRIFQYLS